MKQKKIRPSQSSVTLLDFFHLPTSKAPIRTKTFKKSIKENPRQTNVPQEVIVIDSDSEVEIVEVISAKRRKLNFNQLLASSSSHSNIKIEEQDRALPRRLGGVSEKHEIFDDNRIDLETTRTGFGIPVLLPVDRAADGVSKGTLNDENILHEESTSRTPPLSNTLPNDMGLQISSFGCPNYLLNSVIRETDAALTVAPSTCDNPAVPLNQSISGQNSSSVANTAEVSPPVRQKAEDVIVDIDLTLDDWDMGDDEYQETSMVEEGSFQESILIGPTLCSMCSRELNDLTQADIRLHQQNCPGKQSFDKNTAEESSTIHLKWNTTPKPLQPISSIRLPVYGPTELVGCDGKQQPSGNNAFSVLMSSFKENEAWKEATVAEDKNFRPTKANGGRRKAPFYKVLQGMPIAVDAFKYGSIPRVTAYFLTHAHSDHYTNLSSTWKSGPIYCSEGTANLIIHMLSVDKKWVHPLPMDIQTIIPGTNGIHVTLIEANHCPGSCLFFFEGPQTIDAGDTTVKSPYVGSSRIFRYLHCGDFRASPRHVLHPVVKGKIIDHIYLDTTYLDPKYTFPPQPLVVSACAELARRLGSGEPVNERNATVDSWITGLKGREKETAKPTLFVIGTYSIGKERIVKAVAHALQSKVYCDTRKAAILRCQADPELNDLLTSDPSNAVVHLLPLGMISSDKLKIYLERFDGKYAKVVGFRPTGWTYVQPSGTDQLPSVNTILTRTIQKSFTHEDLKVSAKSTPLLQVYPVPYSEHSSFYELTCFAMSLSWGRMIATVNVGSETSRGKMAKWFARWEAERKKLGKVEVVAHRHLDYW